ncbi:MAG: hypothetical protein EOS51_18120 [Mesorhizobium sp.]|nr:MAG: hypothetical protein EOS51_18120 [Mesorhizobium sp.]
MRRRSLLPPKIVPTILEMIATLDDAAERTGDRCYVRARNALAASAPGRPKLDDRLSIQEAKWLLETGQVSNLNQALLMVAKTENSHRSTRSIAERLRRKIKAETKNSSTK